MGKRTFRNCRFFRSGDVLFADMEVFKGQGNETENIKTYMNNIMMMQKRMQHLRDVWML